MVEKKIPQKKIDQVTELKTRIKESPDFILSDYRGLTVEQITKLRKQLFEKKLEYKVIKNNLFLLAARENSISGLDDLLVGPIGVIFCKEDPVEPSKILSEFTKSSPLKVRGGYIDGNVVNNKSIDELSKLPGKDAIIAKIIGCLKAPASNILRCIQDPATKLTRLVSEISKKETK